MKQGTKFIHAGMEPDPSTGAIMTPIYQTSTYVQEAPGVNKGYEYARSQNPTRKALEDALAVIENGKYGLAFSSGVAATDAVIKLLQPGDEVIAASDMYGGTYRLFTKVFEKFGIKFIYTDTTDPANVSAAITPKTKLIWLETPTNPLMNITDIAAIAAISKKAGSLLCVDNTFASPYLQNPLDLGADIVMHSSTKYIGGHSDIIQGALVMNDDALRAELFSDSPASTPAGTSIARYSKGCASNCVSASDGPRRSPGSESTPSLQWVAVPRASCGAR